MPNNGALDGPNLPQLTGILTLRFMQSKALDMSDIIPPAKRDKLFRLFELLRQETLSKAHPAHPVPLVNREEMRQLRQDSAATLGG